jgi:cytochrome c553
MNKLALIFTVVLALISTYTFAAGDATKGQTKAVSCVGCHGVDGNSLAPTFPKLSCHHDRFFDQVLD